MQAKLQQIIQFFDSTAAPAGAPDHDKNDELVPTLDAKVDNAVIGTAEPSEEFAQKEIAHIESLVRDLTDEGKEMLRAIDILESEKRALQEKMDAIQPLGDEIQESRTPVNQKLQQDFLNLQAQHIELEERYQELKSAQ